MRKYLTAALVVAALPFSGVIRGEFGLDAAGEVVQFGDGAMRDAAEAVHLEH